MSIQETMKATLAKAGIPAHEIQVYGSQIVITTMGESTARKWAALLGKFATVRRVMQSWDERPNGKRPVKVWRTFAHIA